MKAKFFIGALLVFGLALAGGTHAAFAQGPDTGGVAPFINPDDYTVSLHIATIPNIEMPAVSQAVTAPAFVDPDNYSVSLGATTDQNTDSSPLLQAAPALETAPSVQIAPVFTNPDDYSVSLGASVIPNTEEPAMQNVEQPASQITEQPADNTPVQMDSGEFLKWYDSVIGGMD